MAAYMKKVILLTLILAGCTRTVDRVDVSGQWILESYDEKKGYVFRKDGIHYKTHCRLSYLYEAGNVQPAISENECSAVLPYLHKPLPLEQGPRGPDLQILKFTETHEGGTKGWHCEFTIIEAN